MVPVLARPLTAGFVTGAAFANGRVGFVVALEDVAGMFGTEEPAEARPVGAIETRLSLPAFSVSLVASGAEAEVAFGASTAVPGRVDCPGRLASFRGSGGGAGVDGAAAVGGKTVAGSSGRRSDAWRWIKL